LNYIPKFQLTQSIQYNHILGDHVENKINKQKTDVFFVGMAHFISSQVTTRLAVKVLTMEKWARCMKQQKPCN